MFICKDEFTEKLIENYGERFKIDNVGVEGKFKKKNEKRILKFALEEEDSFIRIGYGKNYKDNLYDCFQYKNNKIAFCTYFLRPGLDGIAAFMYALGRGNKHVYLYMREDMYTDAAVEAWRYKYSNIAKFHCEYYSSVDLEFNAEVDIDLTIESFINAVRALVLKRDFRSYIRSIVLEEFDYTSTIQLCDYEFARNKLLAWNNILQMKWIFKENITLFRVEDILDGEYLKLYKEAEEKHTIWIKEHPEYKIYIY